MGPKISLQYVLIFGFIAASLYFLFPVVEEKLLKKINAYVDHCQNLSYKMYEEIEKINLILIIVLCIIVFAGIGFVITRGQGWVQYLFTFSFGFLGLYMPKIYFNVKWEKRLDKFNEQLVDALTLLSNSLKSGLNLTQAIQILVTEMPNPISQEFGTVMSQEKLGRTIDEAFEAMMERIPSEDLSIAINSILILRETGGDLSETFETISNTIRQRRKIEGKIQSMTAQGKTQGAILMLLPFVLIIAMHYLNPTYILPLIKTELGWIFIFIMLIFQTVGFFWMRKIIKIDV
ncbi:MAG: type II secretion system F family protein [Deltaproteobacteria bacterium]|nr:type II secretion system F family protein [Deltaproteobacteria bacterium]